MKKNLIALCALSLSLGACTDLTYEGEILSWTVQEPEPPVPGDETTDPSQGTTKPDSEKQEDGGECVLNATCHVNPPGNDECPVGDKTCKKDECADGDETCKKDECPEGDETCKKDECPEGGEDCPSVPETPEPPEDSCENEKSREMYAKGLDAVDCEKFCGGNPKNCKFIDIRNFDEYYNLINVKSDEPAIIRFIGNVVLKTYKNKERVELKNKLIVGVPWVNPDDKTDAIDGNYALITSDQLIGYTLLDDLKYSTVKNIHLKYNVDSNQRAVFSKNLTNTSVHDVVFEGNYTTFADGPNIGGIIANAECDSKCTFCKTACTDCEQPCADHCSDACRIQEVGFKGKMMVQNGKQQIGGIIGLVENYELNGVTFEGTLIVGTDSTPDKDKEETQIKNIGGVIGHGTEILLNNASFYGELRAAKAYSAVGGVIGNSDNSKLMNCVAGSEQTDENHIVKYRNYVLKKVKENSEYILERGAERVAHGAIIQATIAKNVGGIVGDMKGGEINNKDVEASVIRRIEGTNNVGGVVGAVNNDGSVSTKIRNVKNIVSLVHDGDRTNPQKNDNSVIGGFIGYGKNLSIENCRNIVDGETKDTGDGADNSLPGVRGINYVGGFAGELAFLEDNEISNILNEVVRVKTESKQSNGGFIGHVEWRNSEIYNVVSLIGEIKTNINDTPTMSTGGFIGRLENFENIDKTDISQIVSIIDTIESSNAGGFIGEFKSNPDKLFKMHTIFSMTEMLTWKKKSAGFINDYAPKGQTNISNVVSAYHKRYHSNANSGYYNGYYGYLFNIKYDDDIIKNYTSFKNTYYYKFEGSEGYGTINAFGDNVGLPNDVIPFNYGSIYVTSPLGWLKTQYKMRNGDLRWKPMPMPFGDELEALLIKP